MPLFLVANQIADNFDPSTVTEAMVRDIDMLNEEMEAAGARFFAGGLSAAGSSETGRIRGGKRDSRRV